MSNEQVEGIVIDMPVLIKARPDEDGRRMVEVEASVELVDSEGDLILQRALLESADSFIANGHLDIDHISELGKRYGIPDPESYIVGRPTEVKDIGEKRTSVVGEIMRSADGLHNPGRNRFDLFWDTFKSEPPIVWRASVYGFPKAGQVIDCSEQACSGGAWRYIIEGLDWRSLAFTRSPVNDKIVNPARIITAKAHVDDYLKSLPFGDQLFATTAPTQASPEGIIARPRNMLDAVGQYHGHITRDCAHYDGFNSTVGFRNHFEYCCGIGRDEAEFLAHALMYHLLLARQRQANAN